MASYSSKAKGMRPGADESDLQQSIQPSRTIFNFSHIYRDAFEHPTGRLLWAPPKFILGTAVLRTLSGAQVRSVNVEIWKFVLEGEWDVANLPRLVSRSHAFSLGWIWGHGGTDKLKQIVVSQRKLGGTRPTINIRVLTANAGVSVLAWQSYSNPAIWRYWQTC